MSAVSSDNIKKYEPFVVYNILLLDFLSPRIRGGKKSVRG